MQRILVVGSAGSGKSTLSRRLARILGLELIHLDALYWNRGWVESDDAEVLSLLESHRRHKQVVHLSTGRAVRAFVAQLEPAGS